MNRRLVLAALLAAVSCGGVASTAGGGSGAGAPLRVGLVEWAGAPSDTALSRQFHTGFVTAVRRLRLEGTVRQVRPDRDPGEALAYLAARGYDLIVMGAFLPAMADVVKDVAADYPSATFLVPDYPRPPGARNIHGFVLRVEEASYLAGHLASRMEAAQRPGRVVVSSVGGVATPPVVRFQAGYRAGAQAAHPRTKVLIGYSKDFNNPRKCRTIALAQIAAGSGAVFDVAGACGQGALAAAKSGGIWGIGVDADQSRLGPHILTSVLKRYDVALLQQLRAFKKGTLPADGTTSLGLRDGAVGLGKLSPRVPSSTRLELDRVARRIVAGEVRIPVTLSYG
jgi:basic membrane protein A